MAAHLAYINKVIITGLLVRDPEYRHTTTGAPVSNFRIATTKRYRDAEGSVKEEVCYIGVAAWHTLAESCRDRLRKGSPVQVEGELKSRVRDTGEGVRRSFVEIRAYQIRVVHDDGSQEDLLETGTPVLAATGSRSIGTRVASHGYDSDPDESPFRIMESSQDGFEPCHHNENEEL
ncbi:MAG: single-stranded DNA-binding protein [bacterium]|nr:single-stranded DNA-binding protein [bacterium]